MRRWAVVLSAVTISLGAATTVAGSASAGNGSDTDPYTASDGHANVVAGQMAGLVPARGDAHGSKPGGGTGPNLSYHGGPVQHGTTVEPIYWGLSWPTTLTSANEKQSGLATLYQGLTKSDKYAGTNSEYSDKTLVDPTANYVGFVTDHSAAPTSAPSTSTIANEVVKVIGASNILPGAYYPVYIDQPINSNYCAWHSAATLRTSGVEFQFGFFPNLDGIAGCDPGETLTTHSEGLAALGNVTGHEFSEMVTDPQLNAWYDSQGNENADKCAWTFNGHETLTNGSVWLIQGNWSNAAYTAGTGYTRGGCINGYPTNNP